MMDGNGKSAIYGDSDENDSPLNLQKRPTPGASEGHQSKLLSELVKGKDLKNRDINDGRLESPSTMYLTGEGSEEKATPKPRRSSRKRVGSRYVESEDMVNPLDETEMWSPALSRALQERYGRGRKRTPRTLTRLMQQHRENERHRHHGLNASIREISQRIPGFDEQNKETKIVKLQRIINYICHLETSIKNLCDMSGFSLDYKNLFLSPHVCKNADEWKVNPKMTLNQMNHEAQRKASPDCLQPHLEKKAEPMWEDGSRHNTPTTNPCGPQKAPRANEQLGSKQSLAPSKGQISAGPSGNNASETDCQDASPVDSPDDLLPLMFQAHDELVDLAWLDHLMGVTPDLDHMCSNVDELPDLLPDDLSDLSQPHQTFAGENYISGSWQKCENMNLDYSNVALIHSYVKNSPSLVMNSKSFPDLDDDTDEETTDIPFVRPLDDSHHTHYPSKTEPNTSECLEVNPLSDLGKSYNTTLGYAESYNEASTSSSEEISQMSDPERKGKLGSNSGQAKDA